MSKKAQSSRSPGATGSVTMRRTDAYGDIRFLNAGETPASVCLVTDSGIVPLVDQLTDAGWCTFASCQGGEGHSTAHPWVRVHADEFESYLMAADALKKTMRELGYRNFEVRIIDIVFGAHGETRVLEVVPWEPVKSQNGEVSDGLRKHKTTNQ